MKILIILLLSALSCYSQSIIRSAAFYGSASIQASTTTNGTPAADYSSMLTNITGYPIYSWYPVTSNYNASGILTNLITWHADLNLTNTTSAPTLMSAGVNGKDYLAFDGANDYLRAKATSVAGAYYDMFVVMSYTNVGTLEYYITLVAGGINSSLITTNQALASRGSASAIIDGTTLSNQWLVVECVMDYDKGAIYTNGVCAATNAVSVTTLNTMTIGGRDNLASFVRMGLAELALYATNFSGFDGPGIAASGNRSNVTWALKQQYAIP